MLLFIDRSECIFWPVLRDDLHVERTRCGNASPDAGKDDLVNIRDFDEHWLFRDEDKLVKHEEIALYGFQVCFETRMTISATSYKILASDSSNEDEKRACLWKLPALIIFFFDNARKTLDTTSKVGFL